jgi:hypothetical protein
MEAVELGISGGLNAYTSKLDVAWIEVESNVTENAYVRFQTSLIF